MMPMLSHTNGSCRRLAPLTRVVLLAGAVLCLAGCATSVPQQAWQPATVSLPLAQTIGHYELASSFVAARTLTGLRVPLRSDARMQSGLIGGVTRPTATSQAVSSGFYWQRQAGQGRGLGLHLLQSEINDDGAMDSESLLQVTSHLLSGLSWLPHVNAAFSLARRDGDAGSSLAGSAYQIGVSGRLDTLDYALHVEQSTAGFDPVGSRLQTGRMSVRARTRYAPGTALHIRQDLLFTQTVDGADSLSSSVLLTTALPGFMESFQQLQLQAVMHRTQPVAHGPESRRWRVAVGGQAWRWHGWTLSSAMSWQSVSLLAAGRSLERYGWLVESDHQFGWGRLASQIALQRGTGPTAIWQPSFGLVVSLRHLARGISLSMDYLSPDDQVATNDNTLRVMLRYNVAANSVFTGMRSLFEEFRPGVYF